MSYLIAAYLVTLGSLGAYGLHLQGERRRERREAPQAVANRERPASGTH